MQALVEAERLAEGADLMLCIGSSLEVYPVAQLPAMTLAAGGQIAILTQGPTPYDAGPSVRWAAMWWTSSTLVLAALELTR